MTAPERRLLLECIRPRRDPEIPADSGVLPGSPLDWDLLLRLASTHGLLELLYWRLKESAPEAAPPAAMDFLRERFRSNHRRNLHLAGELCRLLELLRGRGIRAIPFKGVVLAASVYEHLALRQFADLDLLVREDDVRGAWDVLATAGYEPRLEGLADPERLLRTECELLFSRGDGRAFVELHWRTAPPHFATEQDPAGLRGRAVPDASTGLEAPCLSREDSLLVLCIHGAVHLWDRLIWLSDLARWLDSHADLDWDRVFREARASGLERILLVGLSLARDAAGTALPAEALERLRKDPRAEEIAGSLLRRFLEGGEGCAAPLETVLLHLRMRERLRDRARYVLRLLRKRSLRDREFFPVPAFLDPITYVSRILRLAWKYSPVLIRRLCHGNGAK